MVLDGSMVLYGFHGLGYCQMVLDGLRVSDGLIVSDSLMVSEGLIV